MNSKLKSRRNSGRPLKDDRIVMLGLAGIEEGHSQPMSAQLLDEEERRPDLVLHGARHDLVNELGAGHRAQLHFSSKGHELFAAVHGELTPSDDRATIDRLWNRFVAAWFEGGKDDPKLQLLRFNPDRAQIWLNEHSTLRGRKTAAGPAIRSAISGQGGRRAARRH